MNLVDTQDGTLPVPHGSGRGAAGPRGRRERQRLHRRHRARPRPLDVDVDHPRGDGLGDEEVRLLQSSDGDHQDTGAGKTIGSSR